MEADWNRLRLSPTYESQLKNAVRIVKYVLQVTGIAVDLQGTINPLKTNIKLYTIIFKNSVRTAQ